MQLEVKEKLQRRSADTQKSIHKVPARCKFNKKAYKMRALFYYPTLHQVISRKGGGGKGERPLQIYSAICTIQQHLDRVPIVSSLDENQCFRAHVMMVESGRVRVEIYLYTV